MGFGYSARGEVTDVYQLTPNSGGYYHVTTSYWPHGAVESLGLYQQSGAPLLPLLTYGMEGEGRVSGVSANSGPNPLTSVGYECGGGLTSVTLGNGDSDTFGCDDNTLRVTWYQFNVGGQAVTGNLAWNANGTLQQLAVTDPINSSNQQTCNYAYDDLERMASFNCGGFSQAFTVDPFGNVQKSGTLSFLPTYNSASNRINAVGGGSFSYDANGNILSTGTGIGTTTYTWDAEGKMLSAAPSGSNSVTVVYDALGRAVETNNGNAPCTPCQLVYDPAGEALASTSGQTLYYARVPLPGGVSAIYGSGLALSGYWHRDWLGSVRLITNYSRTVYGDGAFAPYGESYAPWGQTAPGWFAGMSANTLSTMSDAMFRSYDPSQGRWISPDPAGLAAVDLTNPQSLNRYAYAGNNPTTLIDPKGLVAVGCGGHPHQHYECNDGGFGGWSGGGGGGACSIDGYDSTCGLVTGLVESGAALRCPDDDCHPMLSGPGVWLPLNFTASAGGYYSCALPGQYGSVNGAGIAAAACANPGSIATNTEFGGNIYKRPDGTYSFTPPQQGTVDTIFINPAIPSGTTDAGDYHTHGAYLPGYDNEHFSGDDVRGNSASGFPGFLGTPGGRIEVYTPSASSQYLYGCVLIGSSAPANAAFGTPLVPQCH